MNDVILELSKDKIVESLKNGIRLDGRKADDYRQVSIKLNISENADGSASVKLGKTEIIAGIKFSPMAPYPDTPDEGTISIGAELLPMASPLFESGPPDEHSIELARVVDRGIRESKCIDFKKLCIREKELVWVAFIDFYVINDDGNLFDCAALASIAALKNARIPKLENDKIVKGEFEKSIELKSIPILCTFAKIGNAIVLDPNSAEMHAMDGRFSCASIEGEKFTAFQKGGMASFTQQEIEWCFDVAIKKSSDLRKQVLSEF